MKKNLIILFSIFLLQQSNAAVTDSRYFPWITPPIIRSLDTYSGVTSNLFFVFANDAYANGSKTKQEISDIWGIYNEKEMSDALLFIGQTTPLLAQWQTLRAIDWHVKQNIEGQGIQIVGEHPISQHFAIGYNLGYMHLFSDQLFTIPNQSAREMGVTPSQVAELDLERREMFNQLGLNSSQWSASGLLDSVLYLRCGKAWEYQAKCREIGLDGFVGIILPTGKERECTNTSSIPFGGNGATGFFIGTDNSFELKEDMIFGFSLQYTTRLKKTIMERIPVLKENFLFGALQGKVSIHQGNTFCISPYFYLGNLRDGFDFCIQYSYTNHSGDVWIDARKNQIIPSNLNGIYNKSKWQSDYISLTLLYDSAKVIKRDTKLQPALEFSWNIPVQLLSGQQVSRSNELSLGIEVCF